MADHEMKTLQDKELSGVAGGDQKEKKWITYTVVEGDSLSKIGFIYGCSVAEIKSWNGLSGSGVWPGLQLNLYTINY